MSRLGQYLQARGLITRDQLDDALSHQTVHGARLGTNLVELGSISVEQLAACLADFHKTPLPERRWLEKPQRAATQRATRSLVERIRFIPMRLEGKVLHAALLDPRHPNVLDDLRFATGCRIQPYVLPEIWMHDWLLQLFKLPRGIRHVETRGSLDQSPQQARVAPRSSAGTRPSPAPARGSRASSSLTQPPPRFESNRTAPPPFDPARPNAPPFFETTAMAHAQATTPSTRARPISGLPPIPSQRPAPARGATTPPPLVLPPAARTGMSVRPPPVPVRTLTDPPVASIEHTSWSWRPPQQAPVPLSFELDPEPTATEGQAEQPPEAPSSSQPPFPTPVPSATRSSTPAGLWRESTPPAAESAALLEEPTTDLDLPALGGDSPPSPNGIDQLEPATPAQTLAVDLATWEAELLAATNRDQLIETAFRIASCFATQVALFIVQQGMVQGQGSMELGISRPLEGVLIPLDADSAITAAATRNEALRADPQARVIDQRVSLILCDDARDIALFPVAIKQRVVNVLYASNGGTAPLGAIAFGALAQLAQQMGAAYEQLILSRKASAAGG